jgi:hypothetical protein
MPGDKRKGRHEKRALGLNFPQKAGRTYKQAVQGLFTAGTSIVLLTSGMNNRKGR